MSEEVRQECGCKPWDSYRLDNNDYEYATLTAENERLKAARIGTLYERYDRLVADHEALIAEYERLQGLLSRAQGGRSE